jgi:hydroxyacylglutathione hydrolase
MLLRRFYEDGLAQASYLIGCEQTREALIVDPNLDSEFYHAAARADGMRITHVAETHIHADFASGARRLAREATAQLYLSDEGGEEWRYRFAAEDKATLLKDGASFRVGTVRIDVMHTPGHTPEHICFLVTDTTAADEPMGIITGDFLFVSDVGRPDLLEKAAGMRNTMEAAARQLYASLQRIRALPDYLQVWPGHGAGSACGKALGSVSQTTLGYEKRFNWAFGCDDIESFVQAVLAGQPEPPRYFARMKQINRDAPPLEQWRTPPELRFSGLMDARVAHACIVDTRPAKDFAQVHLPGSLTIPLNKSFSTYAGSVLSYNADLYIIVPRACAHCAQEVVRQLALIDLHNVAGYFDESVLDEARAAGMELESLPQISAAQLAPIAAAGEATVLDVRRTSEWEAGHVEGALHIPLSELPARLGEIPRDRPLIVHCQGGGRSAIASSLLIANGFGDVANLSGGFGQWQREGNPVARKSAE